MVSYIRSKCFGFQNKTQSHNFQKIDEKIKKIGFIDKMITVNLAFSFA